MSAIVSVFENVIHMSGVASIVILAVLLLRECLKKAPKLISYALWSVVLLRLICPFTVESAMSIIPENIGNNVVIENIADTYVGDTNIYFDNTPEYEVAVEAGVKPIPSYGDAGGSYVVTAPDGVSEAATLKTELTPVLSVLWLCGMAAMAVWSMVDYLRLRTKLRTAMREEKGVYVTDAVATPFVLGFIVPKIYLPASLNEREREYILLHERCHLRRGDHWIKLFAFMALAIHWFNPLVWLAFIMSSRDMEMSCDEAVLKVLGAEVRAEYSASLLSLATGRRVVSVTPLAFGEGDPKARIKNLANWRKPTVWIIIAAVIVCILAAACLLTDPVSNKAQINICGSVFSYSGRESGANLLAPGAIDLGELKGIVHDTDEAPTQSFYGTNLDARYAGQPLILPDNKTLYLKDEKGFFLVFKLDDGYDTPALSTVTEVAVGDFDRDGRSDYIELEESLVSDIIRIRLRDRETGSILWGDDASGSEDNQKCYIYRIGEDGLGVLIAHSYDAAYSVVHSRTFYIENGKEKLVAQSSSELNLPETNNEAEFIAAVRKSLPQNSTVLLSTIGGIRVIGPVSAAGTETELGLYDLLKDIKAGEIKDLWPYDGVDDDTLVKLLNGLDESTRVEDRSEEGNLIEWSLWIYLEGGSDTGFNYSMRHLELECGPDENFVLVRLVDGSQSQHAWFEDEELYNLLRHMRDYEELIEDEAWEKFGYIAQAVMLNYLEMYRGNPMEFQRSELTRLVYLGGYDHHDGSRVDIYDFRFAFVPKNKVITSALAGGAYVDGDMRVQGFGPTHLAVKHYDGVAVEYAVLSDSFFVYSGGDIHGGLGGIIESNLLPVPEFVEDPTMEEKCLAVLEAKMNLQALHIEVRSGYGNGITVSNYWISGMDWYCHAQGQGSAFAELSINSLHYETDGGARDDVGLWYGPEVIGGRPSFTVARDSSDRRYLRTETWQDGSYDVCFEMDRLESFWGEQTGTTERFCFNAEGELKSVLRVTETPDGPYSFEMVFHATTMDECRQVLNEAYTECINSINLREGTLSEGGYSDNGELIFSVPYGESVALKLNFGSVDDVLMIDADANGLVSFSVNGKDYMENVLMWAGGIENPAVDRYPEYYLIRPTAAASPFICVYDDGPSGDPETHFFSFDGMLHYHGCIPCHPSKLAPDGKGNMKGMARLSVFQTWDAEFTWSFDNSTSHWICRADEFYFVEEFEFISYTLGEEYFPPSKTRPLLVDVYAYAEMDTSGKRWIQSEGTEMSILGTDNEEWLLVRDSTGEEYYLHLSGHGGTNIETPDGETIGLNVFKGLHYFG